MAKKKTLDLGQFFETSGGDDDLTFLLGAGSGEAARRAAERGLPLVHLPTEAVAPDPRQLRHLPPPDELLRLAEAGDRGVAAILEGLRELGRSIAEHGQIQPVIVYADSDPNDPAVTHRLLNGQRRWSAALLMQIPTIWAVEVPAPTNLVRMSRQFEENERREGFSDMERAWGLVELKEALEAEAGADVPWSALEQRLQLSTPRRQDLLRLLRFAPGDQELIRRYGWSEWTLRPLHMAISAGHLDQDEASDMLRVLSEANEVNATVVERLVVGYRREKASGNVSPRSKRTDPGPGDTLHNESRQMAGRLARLRHALERLLPRMAELDDSGVREELRGEAQRMRDALDMLIRSRDD